MDIGSRIEDFKKLSNWLSDVFKNDTSFKEICVMQSQQNRWFTLFNIERAILGVVEMIESLNLDTLQARYPFLQEEHQPKTIAVISAGNIPMAGFHDFLTILISGHHYQGKLSKEDNLLLPAIAEKLIEINAAWKERISFIPKLTSYDKVIATGGNNSARYFEYYFKDVPLLLRHHRNSVAVLRHEDSADELKQLAEDIFTYFGLGCRSISKIYIPENYDFSLLIDVLKEAGKPYVFYHAYANILLYQQAIYGMNLTPIIDGEAIILLENSALASPMGVIHYETYTSLSSVNQQLFTMKEDLQCIVSNDSGINGATVLGGAQSPSFYDFPDGEDIVLFCCK